MKNGFRVMDSDMHVIEPSDLWDRYIDAAFHDRRPRGAARWPGDMQIELEGKVMPDVPTDWGRSRADEQSGAYSDGYANNFDSASQLRAMDSEGIDVAIMFPSRGLFALALDTMDPALSAAVAHAYNLWLSDFCSESPKRMLGAGMVSPFDVQSACAEAETVVKDMGFKSVFIRPNIVEGRNWYHPDYHPLWETLESLGVPIGFHEGATAAMNQVGKGFDTYMMHHTCCHPMEMMLGVVSMCGSGVLDRFPDLQVAFLEGNSAWAPWLLWRLDEHYELSGKFENPDMKLTPSEYFRRQCYVSIEADEAPATIIEDWGLTSNVVFSTDYPHNDSKFPHAIEGFLTMPLSDEARKAILWDNCARLYSVS